jgi:hypothetical protein
MDATQAGEETSLPLDRKESRGSYKKLALVSPAPESARMNE